MSLLMDALRKAEQAKKQAAGAADAGLERQGPLSPREGIRPVSESGLSLEGPEGQPFDREQDPVEVTCGVEVAAPASEAILQVEGCGSIVPDGLQDEAQAVESEVTPETVSPEIPVREDDSRRVVETASETVAAPAVSGNLVASPASVGQSDPETLQMEDGPKALSEHPGIVSAEASRQTARGVFAVKQEFQRRSRNRRLLVLGLAGGLVATGMAGFYFLIYRSMLPPLTTVAGIEAGRPPQAADGGAAQPVAVVAETAEAPVSVAEKDLDAGVRQSADRVTTSSPDPTLASQAAPPAKKASLPEHIPGPSSSPGHLPPSVSFGSPQATTATGAVAPEKAATAPVAPVAAESVSPSTSEPETPAPPESTIVISHRAASPQASPLLSAAYGAYRDGDFVQARQKYQQALQADPRNRGALLGMAAIAVHGRENSLARDLYLRVLDLEPGDPLARAGLLAIAPTGDPAKQESELKLLLEQHPQMAVLFLSLGNLYAGGQRWSEAQQAYFNALQAARNSAAKTGGVHPDYPFNLGVSLEHLGQVTPAVKYYREAVKLAAGHSAGFDAQALEARLLTLDREGKP